MEHYLEEMSSHSGKHGSLNLIQPNLWASLRDHSRQEGQILAIRSEGARNLVRLAALAPRCMHLQPLDACKVINISSWSALQYQAPVPPWHAALWHLEASLSQSIQDVRMSPSRVRWNMNPVTQKISDFSP